MARTAAASAAYSSRRARRWSWDETASAVWKGGLEGGLRAMSDETVEVAEDRDADGAKGL